MDKLDYKKEYKELYQPKTKPSIIEVPEMIFIAVDGEGNPNTCPEYKAAIEEEDSDRLIALLYEGRKRKEEVDG